MTYRFLFIFRSAKEIEDVAAMKKISFAEIQERLASLTSVQKVLLFAGTLLVMGAIFYFLEVSRARWKPLNGSRTRFRSSNTDWPP